MALPRLQPDENDLDITFTVSAALRPYLTKWYQETKLDGESVQDFVLRILKEQAKNDYIAKQGKQELDSIDASRNNEADTLIQDIEVFRGEL